MSSLLSNPSHRAKIGYNGFDMSNYLKFSSSVGQLLPVYYDILSPDDKVSLQAQIKTRTMELESAAMCQLNEYLEWFFVPMNQLSHAFGSILYNISDLDSSFWTSNDISLPDGQKDGNGRYKSFDKQPTTKGQVSKPKNEMYH